MGKGNVELARARKHNNEEWPLLFVVVVVVGRTQQARRGTILHSNIEVQVIIDIRPKTRN